MKILLVSIGKAQDLGTKTALDDFTQRVTRYFPCEWKLIPPSKSTDPVQMKKQEAQLILSGLQPDDFLILLDETGKNISSPELAQLIQQKANESRKQLIFLIGGAYGVDKTVFERAQFSWSLSRLVFPHQLVRLLLAEQVYRACSILKNEKYHHS